MGSPLKTADRSATLAKPLAPEDVRAGDYVAVLDVEHEWAAASWWCDPPVGAEPVVRVRFRPSEATAPLRVVDACLPFVFVEPPKGEPRTLDLRSVRLARLDRGYARRVWKAIRQPPKRRNR